MINGLGSIIKSITGNADNDDIERLTKEIEQNRHVLKEQISMTSHILDDFHNQLINLTLNQQQLRNATETLIGEVGTFFLYADLLFHVETLNNLLERLSNAMTFAQHGMYHYSIIKHNVLLESLRFIPKNQLITDDMLMLTPYLKVQVQRLNNQYFFIITIPLVEEYHYEYLDITPIIQPSQESLCTYPVARHKQLLQRDKVYEATECEKEMDYICTKQITKLTECEENIIKFNEKPCNLSVIHCPTHHWTEISNNIYLIYASAPEKIEIDCKDGVRQTTVKGSVLVRNKDCRVKFREHLIEAVDTPEEILRIPELKLHELEQIKPIHFNLDENHMKQQIQQLNDLKEMRDTPRIISTTSIFIWIVAIIIIISVVLWKRYSKKQWKPQRLTQLEEDKPESIEVTNVARDKEQLSSASIFLRG